MFYFSVFYLCYNLGAAVGIGIGAAAFVGIAGYGGKKGWDMYQNHFNAKDTSVTVC